MSTVELCTKMDKIEEETWKMMISQMELVIEIEDLLEDIN